MRVRKSTLLAAIASASCALPTVHSFAPLRAYGASIPSRRLIDADRDIGLSRPSPRTQSSLVVLSAGPPVISNWKYLNNGTVKGVVTNHPTIPNGSSVTTSQIRNPEKIDDNSVIQTSSGSRYKLDGAAKGTKIPAAEARKLKEKETLKKEADKAKERGRANAATDAAKKKNNKEVEKKRSPPKKVAPAAAKKRSPPEKVAPAVAKKLSPPKKATPAPLPKARVVSSDVELNRLARSQLSLVGESIGPKGKYLLAGRPGQSRGRQAKIWTAYLADPKFPGLPAGFAPNGDATKVKPLTIKVSPDVARLSKENTNYDKVTKGFFSGMFVKKSEYFPIGVPSSDQAINGKVAALVIESGMSDLRTLLSSRGGRPLAGRALRDAACSAGQCVQGVHSSGLVWTDLKTENFVVVGSNKEVGFVYDGSTDDGGRSGLKGVKGIDLESAVLRGENPIDYSPEASPPEFAKAYSAGSGTTFVLEYSYDMWSLGMMLYELSTGRQYFERLSLSPAAVNSRLCDPDFEVDVSDVPDPKLRDLIGRCLRLEPKKRPDITGFLLHPYFITTGFFSFSF